MRLSEENRGALAIGARQLLYMLVCIGVMLVQHAAARHYHADTYAENGLVENMQFVLLFASCIVFLAHAVINRKDRTMLLILSGLCALGGCREMDRILDALIPVVSWKIGILFVVAPCIWAATRFEEAIESLSRFLRSRCFVMLCGAFTIVLVLAQLIGHKSYLAAVLVDLEHFGTIKEMVEESIETIGYVIILLASIESWFKSQIRNEE